uniref:Uncharacterized protein n=1 Tax=Picea glauca TaxID=3330 RepID=A0A101LWL7_PICGL|nr:hypothetical protein ABT39_MTgene1361 [Picea glauca]
MERTSPLLTVEPTNKLPHPIFLPLKEHSEGLVNGRLFIYVLLSIESSRYGCQYLNPLKTHFFSIYKAGTRPPSSISNLDKRLRSLITYLVWGLWSSVKTLLFLIFEHSTFLFHMQRKGLV